MSDLSVIQRRSTKNTVLIAATKLIFKALQFSFPCYPLSDVVTIHNGRGLKTDSREQSGIYNVYASGGLVGFHSETLSSKPFVVIGRKGSAGKPTYAPNGGWVIDTAYFAQPQNEEQLDCEFLFYAISSLDFSSDIITTAIPGINRTSIYKHLIPVPPKNIQHVCVQFFKAAEAHRVHALPELPTFLDKQRRIVAHIEALATRIAEVHRLSTEKDDELNKLLLSAYYQLIENVKLMPMVEIAPIVRRSVDVQAESVYHELGIRSFGNGTFHKPAISGFELGSKRIYQIEPGDLLFSNVFAWEGAIAVAKEDDLGRVGSHRFITCVPKEDISTSTFLCFHFLTPEGLSQIREASPGGAGRNRTLGLEKLERIKVPLPAYEKQLWFNNLHACINALKRLQAETTPELDALLPAVLDRAFRGELL